MFCRFSVLHIFVVWIWAKVPLVSGLSTLQKMHKSNQRYHFFSSSRFQTSTTTTEFSPKSLKHFFGGISGSLISLSIRFSWSLSSRPLGDGRTSSWSRWDMASSTESAKKLSFQTDRNTEGEGEGSMLKDIVPASTDVSKDHTWQVNDSETSISKKKLRYKHWRTFASSWNRSFEWNHAVKLYH